jgi:hypothetical protein
MIFLFFISHILIYSIVAESAYGLFTLPSCHCRPLGDLAALAGRHGSSPSGTANDPSKASQGDRMGVLNGNRFKWGSIHLLTDSFLYNPAGIGYEVMRFA